MQAVSSLEASLEEACSRIGGLEASAGEANSRANGLEASLEEACSSIEGLEALIREANSRANGLEASLQEACSRIDDSAREIGLLNAELLVLKRSFGEKSGKLLWRIINWKNYDAAYQEWKKYKKKRGDKRSALENIDSIYGIFPFFFFYPVYKTIKPIAKCKRALERMLLRRATATEPGQTLGGERAGMSLIGGSVDSTGVPHTNGVSSQVSHFSTRVLRVVYISGEPDIPGHVYRVVRYVESLSAAGVQTTWIAWMNWTNAWPKSLERRCWSFGALLMTTWSSGRLKLPGPVEQKYCSMSTTS